MCLVENFIQRITFIHVSRVLFLIHLSLFFIRYPHFNSTLWGACYICLHYINANNPVFILTIFFAKHSVFIHRYSFTVSWRFMKSCILSVIAFSAIALLFLVFMGIHTVSVENHFHCKPSFGWPSHHYTGLLIHNQEPEMLCCKIAMPWMALNTRRLIH